MENAFASQKIESRPFYYPEAKLFPRSLLSPHRQRQITHSPQLKGRTKITCFKMYCFKSTFLKHIAEEWTFCGKNLLVTLSEKTGGYIY